MYGSLGDPTPEQQTALIRQLHTIAQAIYDARQAGDVDRVRTLQGQFQVVADAIRAQGKTDMTAIDRMILATGQYVEGVVDAIPQAIAALPRAATSAVALTLKPLILPALAVGALLWLWKR